MNASTDITWLTSSCEQVNGSVAVCVMVLGGQLELLQCQCAI